MRNLALFFLILISISCISPKESYDKESNQIECLKEKSNIDIYDIMSFSKNFEQELIRNKLLKGTAKKNYLILLADSRNGKNDWLKQVVKNISQIENITSSFLFEYKDCLYSELKLRPKNKTLIAKIKAYEDFEHGSLKDYKSLREVINLTNFQRQDQRLVTTALVYIYFKKMFF